VDFELGLTAWDVSIRDFLDAGGTAAQLQSVLPTLCGTVYGDALEPLLAYVVSKDFDLDGKDDVLVAVTTPFGHGDGTVHVIAFLEREAGYEPHRLWSTVEFSDEASYVYSSGGGRIVGATDMTGDGYPEIVFSVHADWPGLMPYAEYVINTWRSGSFVSLIEETHLPGVVGFEPETIYYATANGGHAEIADADADGRLDMVIVLSVDRALASGGSQVLRRQIWSWDGSHFSRAGTYYSPKPKYRIEAVMLGDIAFANDDTGEALALYQQAVFDESLLGWSQGYDPQGTSLLTPDPDERVRLAAYARYRIMLLHAALGHEAEAEVLYISLQQRFPVGSAGFPYAELATQFRKELAEEGWVFGACDRAEAYAARNEDLVLTPLGPDYYGEYGLSYGADDICPWGL